MRKFENYSNALDVLSQSADQDLGNEFVQSGIIGKFSLQFELGWKLLKELLVFEGESTAVTGSPRDVIKAAYRTYDFMDEELWLSMLRERNSMIHVYDSEAARNLVKDIISKYIPEFLKLRTALIARYGEMLEN